MISLFMMVKIQISRPNSRPWVIHQRTLSTICHQNNRALIFKCFWSWVFGPYSLRSYDQEYKAEYPFPDGKNFFRTAADVDPSTSKSQKGGNFSFGNNRIRHPLRKSFHVFQSKRIRKIFGQVEIKTLNLIWFNITRNQSLCHNFPEQKKSVIIRLILSLLTSGKNPAGIHDRSIYTKSGRHYAGFL